MLAVKAKQLVNEHLAVAMVRSAKVGDPLLDSRRIPIGLTYVGEPFTKGLSKETLSMTPACILHCRLFDFSDGFDILESELMTN